MFLYSEVSSPLDRSKRFTLFAPPPGRPVHSDTNSASLGSILAMQQLRATTKHSHISTTFFVEWFTFFSVRKIFRTIFINLILCQGLGLRFWEMLTETITPNIARSLEMLSETSSSPTQCCQCGSGWRVQTEMNAINVSMLPRIGSLDWRIPPWLVRNSLCKDARKKCQQTAFSAGCIQTKIYKP